MRGRGAARTNEREALGLAGNEGEGEGERKVYDRDGRTDGESVAALGHTQHGQKAKRQNRKGRETCAARVRARTLVLRYSGIQYSGT